MDITPAERTALTLALSTAIQKECQALQSLAEMRVKTADIHQTIADRERLLKTYDRLRQKLLTAED
jgi:hypothetical protein